MYYYINTQTDEMLIAGGKHEFGTPWKLATQPEIDNYLLKDAKVKKRGELRNARNLFCVKGYEYSGYMGKDDWLPARVYAVNDEVTNETGSKTYVSLANNNTNNDPDTSPEWWRERRVRFKIDYFAMTNLIIKCEISATAPARYEFYAKEDEHGRRPQIDFKDAAHWDLFVKEFAGENDRMMRKYNDYQNQISAARSVAELDAIIIDFS